MGASGARQPARRTPPRPAPGGAAGQPSARVRAGLLEYAVAQLLPPGSERDALAGVLERVAADLGARAALVVAPGTALPLGEEAVFPADIRNDPVLLAQIRSAWAAHGGHAAASGHAFQVELNGAPRRTGLLVAPAEPDQAQRPCALALVGDTTRWKAGARSTLKALATIVSALLSRDSAAPAAHHPARAARREPPRSHPGQHNVRRLTRRGYPDSSASPGDPGLSGSNGLASNGFASNGLASNGLASASDDLARALVAGAPSAIVAVDSSRRIREFNPSAEDLFGRSRADAIGRDMPATLVPESYRQLFIDAMAGYLATGDGSGFARRFRLRALRADGTERPVDLTPMPVTVGGETYFFGFLRDVSELEAATTAVAEGDARFRLLSDLAPVGIMQSAADGTCRFVNDKWCQLTGFPPEEVIGRNWRSTINSDDVARIDAMRDESGHPEELATDCRLIATSGREVWVHAVVRRVTDARGALIGRVTALTDVDHRKRDEEAREQDRRLLSQQNTELRDISEARMRYLATVSHELRTPLTSVVSFAELMRSENPDLSAESAEYLDIIQRNAERLLRVVSDLLDLSSLEEGLTRLDLRPISVPGVARESVRTGWSIAAVDGVSLDITAEDGPAVRADEIRLQQVLDNLISNAVKFTAVGGRVEVRATHDTAEWRVDVADSGIGIPPAEVDHLFDRFYRASNARQSEVPGTGLGLPTAKAITERLGGRIEVTSVVGRGTTFTVYLPIRR